MNPDLDITTNMLVIFIIITTLSLKTDIKLLGMDKANKFKIESGKTNPINFDELVALKHHIIEYDKIDCDPVTR